MNALCTRPFWLAFAQPCILRGFALGRGLASFIAGCAILLSTASTASAGCGYWMSGTHAEHGKAADLDGEDAGHTLGFLSPELSHPTPLPCHGPNCGKAPQVPAQPVSASELPSIKVFGCRLGGESASKGLAAGRMVADALQTELSGYPLRIDRPPVL